MCDFTCPKWQNTRWQPKAKVISCSRMIHGREIKRLLLMAELIRFLALRDFKWVVEETVSIALKSLYSCVLGKTDRPALYLNALLMISLPFYEWWGCFWNTKDHSSASLIRESSLVTHAWYNELPRNGLACGYVYRRINYKMPLNVWMFCFH